MSKWDVSLSKLAERYGARMDVVARKSTMELFSAIVQDSPVLSGRFRANWNVSHGAPDLSVTDSTDESRGQREAASVLSLPVGGTVFLANSLPYASRLENGYSRKAPHGMVALNVQRWEDFLRAAVEGAK